LDPVKQTFDEWAKIGRSELMEKEHSKNVLKFLSSVSFDKPFSFLDIGCGNGWVVRKIAQHSNCKKAVGIDKSKNMITNAKSKKISQIEKYHVADIDSWANTEKFDFIFSMESLYYVKSIKDSLQKIYKHLKSNGKFFCGTDFYKDNKATAVWSEKMKIPMHLHSKYEWKKLFLDAGFDVKTKHIKDLQNSRKWKREFGTLFIIGTKP